MADIQRFPPGFLELLGMRTSGALPAQLDGRISGSVDVTQLYGLANIQNLVANAAAAAEGSGAALTVPADTWYVLYAASVHIVKTATMGDGAFSIRVAPNGSAFGVAIATEYIVTNTSCSDWAVVGWTAPYPMLLAPGTSIAAVADLVSTDATVNISIRIRVGVLN